MKKLNILLHICCAPCGVYPIKVIKEKKIQIRGYFYNPNIHPFKEYERRQNSVHKLAEDEEMSVSFSGYDMENFLRNIVFRESERCLNCYTIRLNKSAQFAKDSGFDYFSTTLLYSRYQNHELIIQTGEVAAKAFGISFYYEDFRRGWKEGISVSKARQYYRQLYCGCIYSEKERYCRI